MKILLKIFLVLILLAVVVPVFFLGRSGFIPGLSGLLGADQPHDLGVVYSEVELTAGRGKSQIVYETLPADTPANLTWQTAGSREVSTTFSSAEISAIMNNKPGIYYPYKNVQVRFNADGSAEISGQLIKDRIPVYAATFGAPQVAVDFVMKFLPPDPVFYLKGIASLEENQVALFEPQRLEIGRFPIPLGPILAFNLHLVKPSYALDLSAMSAELSKIDNKRALIIGFINSRLANIEGFYAKKAYFAQDQLVYEGTLPEREATVR